MAENNDVQNIDLAQLLQTLANLPKPQNTTPQPPEQAYDPSQPLIRAENVAPSHHPAQAGISYGHEQSLDPRLSSRPQPSSRQHPTPQNRTSTPVIDPATITEWKHGLRCVNKLAAQNPNFVSSVQKLMKDQERNVKDWESGRQRLIDDQVLKRENEMTHRAALSLPGILDNTVPLRTPKREQEELAQYDQKVYRACRLMVESQSAQLKSLGVPFFGVKPDLVLPDGVEESDASTGQETSKKITKTQLLDLQRKMLNHLMEMYGD